MRVTLGRSAVVTLFLFSCRDARPTTGVAPAPRPEASNAASAKDRHSLEAPFDDVFQALASGHSVTTRLGVFYVLPVPAYEGRNPRTDAVVVVAARRRYLFLASDELVRAAFGASGEEPFADRHAELLREEPGVLAPRSEVAVSQAEVERISAALAAARQSPDEVALGRLGVLRTRPFVDGRRFAIQFHPSAALKATATPN